MNGKIFTSQCDFPVMTVITVNIPIRCSFTIMSVVIGASHIIVTKPFCVRRTSIESRRTSQKTNFKLLVVSYQMLLRNLEVRAMLSLVAQKFSHDIFVNGILY